MWRDWAGHLGVDDPDGMARFIPAGNLICARPATTAPPSWRCGTSSASRTSGSTPPELRERFPGLDVGRYYPPKRIDDPAFGDDADGELTAFYNADSGYIDDPMLAAHNLAHAARAPRRRVPLPASRRRSIGRRAGA